LLVLTCTPVKPAEAEVAMGDERTHLQFIGECERFTTAAKPGEQRISVPNYRDPTPPLRLRRPSGTHGVVVVDGFPTIGWGVGGN